MGLNCTYKQPASARPTRSWETVSLRDHLVQDATYGVVKAGRFQRTGVPMVRGGDIQDGMISDDQPFITPEKSREYSRTELKERDVLIALVGYPGESAVVPRRLSGANISRAVGLLRPVASLLPEFLACYLNSPAGRAEFLRPSAGSAQIVVNLGALNRLRVPLPPISEQERIASAIDDATALLHGLTRHIAKKRDLKQAAMQQLLTGRTRLPGFGGEWAPVRLAEIGNTYGGLAGKSSADFGAGGARYIAFMDVIRSVSIRSGSTFERVRVGSGEAQNAVKRGDLLLNGSSETSDEVAMCALCDVDEQDLFLNSFCFGFRFHPKAEADALFLAYLLRSDAGRAVMRSRAQGSTRYNIAKSAFLDACLLLPSTSEQAEIATVLSDMDAELAALEARRAKTHALKQAMMQSLLTGRIRLVSPERTHA